MILRKEKLPQAISEYVATCVMPSAKDAMTKFALGVVIANPQAIVNRYLRRVEVLNWLEAFEVLNSEGDFDLDRLYKYAKDGMKYAKEVKLAGFVFEMADIDEVFTFLKKHGEEVTDEHV